MKNNLEDMLKRQDGAYRQGTGVSGLSKTAVCPTCDEGQVGAN
jgi:hypothetical protein